MKNELLGVFSEREREKLGGRSKQEGGKIASCTQTCLVVLCKVCETSLNVKLQNCIYPLREAVSNDS